MNGRVTCALSLLLFIVAGCSGAGNGQLPQTATNGAPTSQVTPAASPPSNSLYADIYEPKPFVFRVNAYADGATGNAKPFAQICCYSGGGAVVVDSFSRVYVGTDTIPASLQVFESICPPLVRLGQLAIPDRQALIDGIAYDPTGEIFIGTSRNFNTEPSLQHTYVFPAGSLGDAVPVRDLYIPHWINAAVDSRGYLYILPMTTAYQADRILVYGPTANGMATPVRTITRANADLTDIKVDGQGRIYTAGFTGGLVFAADANGDATPIAQTPVREGKAYASVAVSASGRIYFGVTPTSIAPPDAVIEEYTLTGSGFAFAGRLDTGVPAAEAHHLAIGP